MMHQFIKYKGRIYKHIDSAEDKIKEIGAQIRKCDEILKSWSNYALHSSGDLAQRDEDIRVYNRIYVKACELRKELDKLKRG